MTEELSRTFENLPWTVHGPFVNLLETSITATATLSNGYISGAVNRRSILKTN